MILSKNKVGLAVGAFVALAHLLWIVLVAANVAQPMMDWIFKLHSLNNPHVVQPLSWTNSLILLISTFVVGYLVGWVFILLHNMLHKK